MVMIGDRLDTDMLLGYNAGIDKCVVLSGVIQSHEDIYEQVLRDQKYCPDYILKSFGVLEWIRINKYAIMELTIIKIIKNFKCLIINLYKSDLFETIHIFEKTLHFSN